MFWTRVGLIFGRRSEVTVSEMDPAEDQSEKNCNVTVT